MPIIQEVDTSSISRMSDDDKYALIRNPLEFFTREISIVDPLGVNSEASQLIDLTVDEETRRGEGATLNFRYCVDVVLVPNRAEIQRASTLSLQASFGSGGDQARKEAEEIRVKEAKRVLDICKHLRGKGIIPALNTFCDYDKPDEVGLLAKGSPYGGQVMYQLENGGKYLLVHYWYEKKEEEKEESMIRENFLIGYGWVLEELIDTSYKIYFR